MSWRAVTAVAAGAAAYAWRGWTPRRLYKGALWCLPMAAAWLIAVAVWPQRAGTKATAPGYRSGGTRSGRRRR